MADSVSRVIRKKPQRIAWILAVSGIIAALAMSSLSNRSQAAPEPSSNKAMVFVNRAKATDLYDVLVYPARIHPKINTTILAESDGIVSKIYAPLGQKVGRGQKLMSIRHTDPVYQYAPVTVTAPVSGIVSQVEITEGSQVSRGERLATVTDPSQLKVTVEVPAQDVASLSKGLKGEFRMEGRSDVLAIKIHGISPYVDPATGTATCEIELDSAAKSSAVLAPGLIGQVSFKTGLRKGISIPDHAILYKGQNTFVRLLENGKSKQVPVKLGKKQRGFVEILSGIADQASIIERSSRFVADGEEVVVQNAGQDGNPEGKKM
jgi:multidrug efflux pump subunit AcrA (membrane-fusion protein)